MTTDGGREITLDAGAQYVVDEKGVSWSGVGGWSGQRWFCWGADDDSGGVDSRNGDCDGGEEEDGGGEEGEEKE